MNTTETTPADNSAHTEAMAETATQLDMLIDTPEIDEDDGAARFADFDLPAQLLKNLNAIGYDKATPIQTQAIPIALEGRDVLGTAQTGTGKTGSFAIPMLAKILGSPRGSAMILLPTRELASQVKSVIDQMLGKRSFIPTVLLIGGEPMGPQTTRLRMRPRVIVGTPGRVNDHLERGNLMLHDTNYFVLDETDRMLDMGFGPQIDKIVKFMPAGRQTMMFSATLPKEILKLSSKYLKNPQRVEIGTVNTAMPQIEQEVLYVQQKDKYTAMLAQLNDHEGTVIIFTNTKREADRISKNLDRDGHKAQAIHGDLHQNARKRVLLGFRNKKFRILVATDIAARGLDVPHIEHVINYNLPMVPEDYIHRIGRTGRNGSDGRSICLVGADDESRWQAIHRMLNPGKPDLDLPNGGRAPRKGGGGGNRRGAPHRGKGGPSKSAGSYKGNRKPRDGNAEGGERKFSRDKKPGGAPTAKAGEAERKYSRPKKASDGPRTGGKPSGSKPAFKKRLNRGSKPRSNNSGS